METSLKTVQEKYNLEIPKIVSTIKKQKAKIVLLQFPEGIKPYAQSIADEIQAKTNTKCIIWLGTCFGACDLPLETEKLGIDLIIQFGHSDWKFQRKDIKVL